MRKLTGTNVEEGVEVGVDPATDNSNGGEEQASPILFDRETIRLHAITAEYNDVAKQALEGIYVLPRAADPSEWHGVMFVRRGVYLGAILRFTLKVDDDFPDTTAIPTITFDVPVFHPNIDARTRQLDMSRHFPDGWKPGVHRLYHTLLVLQRTFFKFDTAGGSAVNAEAAALLDTDRERYKALVTECVRHSREVVYDQPTSSDQHVIRFTPWDASLHESVRRRMLSSPSTMNESSTSSGGDSRSSSSSIAGAGLSWVNGDELVTLAENEAP